MRCWADQSRGAWCPTIVVGSNELGGVERSILRKGCGQRGPPPRGGCSLEILIDGEEALPRIADEISGARSHVWLAGWQFAPSFALRRDGQPAILRNLLAQLSERVDVRVLAWAGAPLPVFPTFAARRSRHARRALSRHEDPVCARLAMSVLCIATTRRRS